MLLLNRLLATSRRAVILWESLGRVLHGQATGRRVLSPLLAVVIMTAAPAALSVATVESAIATANPLVPLANIEWPSGTTLVEFENLEGLIVFGAHLRSTNGADTTALLVFDSGAGYLALDHQLA